MIVQSFHNSFHCSFKKALGIIIIIIVRCSELYHRSFVRNQQLQLIPLGKFSAVSAIVRVFQLHLATLKLAFF